MGADQPTRDHHRRSGARLNRDVKSRWRIRVVGRVQGVGFRPFVYRLATELGFDGWITNDDEGVLIELSGLTGSVDVFLRQLLTSAPPLADVESVVVEQVPENPIEPGFFIRSSTTNNDPTTLVPADVRTCDECLREMRDPFDRRFRHALINCTDCGPRFTIVRAIPYDRANTTMSDFDLCPECTAEYNDPTSRRFHAEPISCRACGPRLRFRLVPSSDVTALINTSARAEPFGSASAHPDDVALEEAIAAIRAGLVVAVKGAGGYALVIDARNDLAVESLRRRKHRDEKPFAIQVASMAMARNVVELSDAQADCLLGTEAPILLARRAEGAHELVSPNVAPDTDHLGVMLPSTGLHHLLAFSFDGPLVVTSGNVSDEPIIIDDDQAMQRLSGIADGFLTHDRQIHRRADDSVVRFCGSTPAVVRRARGFVPNPIRLPGSIAEGPTVLGVGAELKNTVCIARGANAFVSTHLGDLEHVEAFRSFRETIGDLQQFLAARPSLVVHDLHPEYLSTKWAMEQDVETLAVQHHHAHIASCMAENGFADPVVGLAFDGHGYGPDGTLWGGEFLTADLHGYERVGHFATVALPGGATAIRQPWRMAVSYLLAAFDGNVPQGLSVRSRHAEQWVDVERVSKLSSTVSTSSVGRLFDTVSALLGICDQSSFEGQAAMALEQRAWAAQRLRDGFSGPRLGVRALNVQPICVVEKDGTVLLDPFAFIRSIAETVESHSGVDVNEVAWQAHRAIADASVQAARTVCERSGHGVVALSGGVFQNALLLGMIRSGLEEGGLRVLTQRHVPSNDGGISFGQVAIGRAQVRGSVAF